MTKTSVAVQWVGTRLIVKDMEMTTCEVADEAKLTAAQRQEPIAKARAKLAELRAANSNYTPPPKIHTLKVPCTFPGCRVTVNHEHV
jgi:hypothetical protein